MSSGQEERRCQCKYYTPLGRKCGKRAAWRYRALSLQPHLLCEECARHVAAVPWMKARLTRLDAVAYFHEIALFRAELLAAANGERRN